MVCVLPYSWGDQTPTIYKIFFLPISSSAPVTAPPCLWNSHPLCITRRALLFSVSSSPCPEQAHHVSTFWWLGSFPTSSPVFPASEWTCQLLPHCPSDPTYPTQPIIFPPKLIPRPVLASPASPVALVRSLRINFEPYAAAAAAKSLQLCPTLRPHGLQPTRLLHPWDSPGKNTGVGCHFLLQCMKVESESEVTQSCPTLSDPMDCSPPGSSIRGIFQATVVESYTSP